MAKLIKIALLTCWLAAAQESNGQSLDSLYRFPKTFISQTSRMSERLNREMERYTEKSFTQFKKFDLQLLARAKSVDLHGTAGLIEDANEEYKAVESFLSGHGNAPYLPTFDTLNAIFGFIKSMQHDVLSTTNLSSLESADGKIQALASQLGKTSVIQKFMESRETLLSQIKNVSGFELGRLKQTVLNYKSQVLDIRHALDDHSKMYSKTVSTFRNLPAFKKYMQKYGQMAALFGPSGTESDSIPNLTGLQTKQVVTSYIELRLGDKNLESGSKLRQKIQDAKEQAAASNNDVPSLAIARGIFVRNNGIKENTQAAKPFKKRIEVGLSLQSVRGNGFVPRSTEVGLSVGYKISDCLTSGIGLSYRFSLGEIRHIALTNLGIGLRSFADVNLKGSLSATVGYERNHQSLFRNFQQLRHVNEWQSSGLLGITKVLSLKSRFLKQTKMQLLWDFLSYSQAPITQPIVFRINYSF